MNKQEKEIILFAGLLIIAVAALTLNFNVFGQEPEIVENGTTSDYNSQALDFQGLTNQTKISDEGLKLDTYTVFEKENLTEASRILATTSDKIYYRNDGETYSWNDGESQKLEFDTTYGAAAGDFKQFEGFNLIYSDINQDVHVRNIDTNTDTVLEDMKAVEVGKTDEDNDGIAESAEVKLRNGSILTFEPENPKTRSDIDEDGLAERINLKNRKIVLYDTKHGQKELASATSYGVKDQTLYIVSKNKLSRLALSQKHYRSGSYVSHPVDANGSLAQIIVFSELNGGDGELTVISNEEKQYSLERGYTDIKIEETTPANNVRLKIELESDNEDKSPLIKNYRIVTR